MNIKTIEQMIQKFSQDRDWEQFHSPKNLSMTLSVESSELVEIFQWLTEEQSYNLNDSKNSMQKKKLQTLQYIYFFS